MTTGGLQSGLVRLIYLWRSELDFKEFSRVTVGSVQIVSWAVFRLEQLQY